MKTTNILLVFIAILLLLNLVKGSVINIIPEALADTKSPLQDQVVNVRIVDIAAFDGALPVIYGSRRLGYVFPVDAGYEVNASSRQTKLLPVAISPLK